MYPVGIVTTGIAVLPMTKNGEARRVPLSSAAIRVLEEERQTSVQSIRWVVFDIHPVAMDKRPCWHQKTAYDFLSSAEAGGDSHGQS